MEIVKRWKIWRNKKGNHNDGQGGQNRENMEK